MSQTPVHQLVLDWRARAHHLLRDAADFINRGLPYELAADCRKDARLLEALANELETALNAQHPLVKNKDAILNAVFTPLDSSSPPSASPPPC